MSKSSSAPTDKTALDRVFTPAHLEALARLPQDQHASHALEVLTAHGPAPSNAVRAVRLKSARALRAAWEVYLDAAEACDLLDAEMVGYLRSNDAEKFRGAIAEGCAAWLLAGKLGHPVGPRPKGRNGKVLDMAVRVGTTDINVEVKAPRVASLNDEWKVRELLQSKLDNAGQKFEEGQCNVLVLYPQFPTALHVRREPLTEAFIAEEKYFVPVAMHDDVEPSAAPYSGFELSGKLLRPKSKPVQGEVTIPQFTRVSAIVSIEERLHPSILDLEECMFAEVKHEVLVVHNPHALVPLSEELFSDYPQFVRRGDVMFWNDKLEAP